MDVKMVVEREIGGVGTRPRAGGRPPAHEVEARRRHLIAVAARLFITDGYEATSLENIAKAAGASKTTIYRNFTDKAGLFRSVLDSFVEPLWPSFTDISTDGKTVSEVLTAFGDLFMSPALFNRETISLMRLVYRESPRFPDLAAAFHEAETKTHDVLAGYLASVAAAKGCPGGADFILGATQFLDLVWGTAMRRLIIGYADFPDETERRTIVRSAVTLFLHGFFRPGAGLMRVSADAGS